MLSYMDFSSVPFKAVRPLNYYLILLKQLSSLIWEMELRLSSAIHGTVVRVKSSNLM